MGAQDSVSTVRRGTRTRTKFRMNYRMLRWISLTSRPSGTGVHPIPNAPTPRFAFAFSHRGMHHVPAFACLSEFGYAVISWLG